MAMRARAKRSAGRRHVLVTGFQPFGGHAINPSAAIVEAIDGRMVAGHRVVAKVLPVDLDGLDRALDAAFVGLAPRLVLALGLAAGEPVIRLERFALNVADFNTPDNEGRIARNEPLERDGPVARSSRLPLARILTALLAAGIPARYSESAGLYLCNAVMYRLLARLPESIPTGFIHLPLLPEQVATGLALKNGKAVERELGGLASMTLALQRQAVETALVAALATATAKA
jgi:pyroglutamyl-peptidase